MDQGNHRPNRIQHQQGEFRELGDSQQQSGIRRLLPRAPSEISPEHVGRGQTTDGRRQVRSCQLSMRENVGAKAPQGQAEQAGRRSIQFTGPAVNEPRPQDRPDQAGQARQPEQLDVCPGVVVRERPRDPPFRSYSGSIKRLDPFGVGRREPDWKNGENSRQGRIDSIKSEVASLPAIETGGDVGHLITGREGAAKAVRKQSDVQSDKTHRNQTRAQHCFHGSTSLPEGWRHPLQRVGPYYRLNGTILNVPCSTRTCSLSLFWSGDEREGKKIEWQRNA